MVQFGEKLEPRQLIEVSESIRTFNEQVDATGLMQQISETVHEAERIVFLGSHYHEQNMELLRSMGPQKGGITAVYGTTVGRSDSEISMIDGDIRQMLHPRGGEWHIYIDKKLDCKGLFREFGSILAR